MFGQKNWLVILVKAHELEIFGHDGATKATLPIPPNIINNLEVIDRDALYALVATWTKTLTYQSTDIIWLLSSSVIFEQTFPDSEKSHWDTLTVQFLDNVPFEELVSRVYNPPGGRSIIATNQDLITALNQAFSAQGYTTKVVVPATLVGVEVELNESIVKKIINNLSQLYKENLIIPDSDKSKDIQSPLPATNVGVLSDKPKSQLPLLLGVFGVLLAILAIVIYLNQ